MIFYNANDRNLDFFCTIDIVSETISSGRTHFAIWGIKHYLTLLVKSLQDHGWINFKQEGILLGPIMARYNFLNGHL